MCRGLPSSAQEVNDQGMGHILLWVDWIIVAVGAIGAVIALIAMTRHQHR
jgi:hypothetical protein